MKHKIKFLTALIISMMPLSSLRILLYRLFFSYKIEQSKIGWLTLFNVDKLEINHASIASFNLFTGPFQVKLEAKSTIGSFNYFKCGQWAKSIKRERKFILRKEALITTQHLFDLFGTIEIGEKSLIAGVRSQFWTHGGMSQEIDIYIGDNCYIGSGVKFAPGVFIPPNSLCAIGTVATKTFDTENSLIAGVPAKIVKTDINWRENWV